MPSSTFVLDVTSVMFALVLPQFITIGKINIILTIVDRFVMNAM
jgi:hypothetical protein